MKNLFLLIILTAFVACGGEKKDAPVLEKKVICGDSVDTEMFDQEGNSYTVRMPGKCDTVEVAEPAH